MPCEVREALTSPGARGPPQVSRTFKGTTGNVLIVLRVSVARGRWESESRVCVRVRVCVYVCV